MSYVEVIFNAPVEGVFTYEDPDAREEPLGCRVIAPFGRREMTGFIVGSTDVPPEGPAGPVPPPAGPLKPESIPYRFDRKTVHILDDSSSIWTSLPSDR